jgi:hypothetical protein
VIGKSFGITHLDRRRGEICLEPVVRSQVRVGSRLFLPRRGHNPLFQKLCWLCLRAHVSLRPVLDRQPLETGDVFVVGSRQHKPIHMSNRGDLTIDEGRWSAERFKPRPLFAVPRRSGLVVRQDRKRPTHDVTEIRFERVAALAFGKPATTTGELVPDGRRNGALGTVLV